MKINSLNDRGVALILVIMMISIIIAVTLDLNRSSRASVYDAANLSDRIQLLYLAKSGFNGGVAMLLADTNGFDGLNEDWAKMEIVAAKSAELFEQGSCELIIEDESGKIQINKLINGNTYNPEVLDLLIRFLSLPEFQLEQKRVYEITDSIKDWIDADDEVTGEGAENSFYSTLSKPYQAKNKPLDCIDEILMIKGVTRELYYGTKETPGIGKYLTVYGDGKINVNTAPKQVMKALFRDISEDEVDRLDEYRRREGTDLSDPAWYKRVPGTANVVISMNMFTTKSDYFKISAAGRLNNMTEKITGLIKKQSDRKAVKLLSWKVE